MNNSSVTIGNIEIEIHKAVQNFLYQIGSQAQKNYFEKRCPVDARDRYNRNNPFYVINPNNDNDIIISSEHFLEGCIRVFLVNPIIKSLLDYYGYKNDWMYGNTFNNFSITNREYEIGAFVEFIFECNNERIGCRYTKASYSVHETVAMDRDYKYTQKKESIPGFVLLNTVDRVYHIDWSGISSEELIRLHNLPVELKTSNRDISLRDFFDRFFSQEIFVLFVNECRDAIARAKAILSLRAIPQLMPTNILSFKETVIKDFSDECIEKFQYVFNSDNEFESLSETDTVLLRSTLSEGNLREAIIGSSLFAKSFITSEYLVRTIGSGLGIDYTSVVAGYLKSVEQLLYLFYQSAFEGENGMKYWDVCNKSEQFDVSKEEYRYDPYCKNGKPEIQEYYYHKKRVGVKAPTFGTLNHFLRYFPQIWRISEEGKEYVYSCLEDYRSYCRNHHFHKDNIDYTDYESVIKIRNNTCVCLYYLLAGFKLLDKTRSISEQLGIEDYSFERLYYSIPRKRGLWHIKTGTGYKGTGFFSIIDYSPNYCSFAGKEMKIVFIEADEANCADNFEKIIFDEEYLDRHRQVLTEQSMPIELKHCRIHHK